MPADARFPGGLQSPRARIRGARKGDARVDPEPVVIAPRWHSAEWWPVLQRIAVDSVVVHDRQDASSTLRDQDFLVGEYLAQVGKLPEPLRNRGWKIDAYYVPESSLALVTPQTPS